jgi:hypothetical protein
MESAQQLIEQRAQDLCAILTERWKKLNSKLAQDFNHIKTYELYGGRKYYKIHEMDQRARNGNYLGAVHAFIDKQTGYVYKPASWKAPAKHVRYQLLEEESYKNCIELADCYGSYLYLR